MDTRAFVLHCCWYLLLWILEWVFCLGPPLPNIFAPPLSLFNFFPRVYTLCFFPFVYCPIFGQLKIKREKKN